ncbi:hypothetical protein CPAR01_03630 [Colletotrichum paranaense]|uniref:Uncharacterized protein n=1 Tax=Colletotrichum paranaense TaxID=1914294 RepID=A0ABQ9STZ9_9PEZI|nr:uncharacterized protein CPAR01_03630 [Colletotrichum paranaense]KAK1542997.1 hypothetical protein CPAR01_03630 [Colletotrichum paranaense]
MNQTSTKATRLSEPDARARETGKSLRDKVCARAAASGDGGNEHQPAVQCDESKLAGSTLWPAASRHISLRVLDGLSNYGLKWTTTSVVQHWPGQVHATHFMSRPPALSRQALAPLVHPVPGGGV